MFTGLEVLRLINNCPVHNYILLLDYLFQLLTQTYSTFLNEASSVVFNVNRHIVCKLTKLFNVNRFVTFFKYLFLSWNISNWALLSTLNKAYGVF